MVDIYTAKTRDERHLKIRQLPVDVVRLEATATTPAMLNFVAGGKVRVSVPLDVAPETSTDAPSGPSAESSFDLCDEPPCATLQEMEDLAVLVASTEYELEVMQADHDAELAAWEARCVAEPWTCGNTSGPSEADAPCISQAVLATGQLINSITQVAIIGSDVSSKLALGLRLTAVGATVYGLAIASTSFLAGYMIGSAIACYWSNADLATLISAGAAIGVMPFEPEFAEL